MKYFILLILLSFSVQAIEHEFNIMNYNIKGLPLPFLKKKKRFTLIAKKLQALQGSVNEPHVIAFQEGMTWRKKIIAQALDYPYSVDLPFRRGIKSRAGLYILSKYPIVETHSTVYSRCAGFDCLARKGIVHLALQIPGTDTIIDLYNTHMQAGKSSNPMAKEEKILFAKDIQNIELIKFIQETHQPNRALFVVGDFNFRYNSSYYEQLINEMGLQDTLLACDIIGCEGTGDFDELRKNNIDHQFFQSNESVEITPLYNDKLWRDYSAKELSDHLAVWPAID